MNKNNIYYNNLSENEEAIINFRENVEKAIIPYEAFLKNSIKKLNKKKFSATFKKIGGEEIKLIPKKGSFYKIVLKVRIELENKVLAVGSFKIIEGLEGFNFEGDNYKIKSLKIKPKIKDICKNKKVIILEDEKFNENYNDKNILLLEDDDFGELKIKPLWLDNKLFKIDSLKQDDEELKFKKIKDNILEIENINVEKPIYLNSKEIKYNLIDEEFEDNLKNYNSFRWGDSLYIFSETEPKIKNYKIEKKIPHEIYKYLNFKNKKIFKCNSIISKEELTFLVENADDYKNKELIFKIDNLKINFIIEKLNNSNDKERFRIQLIENEDKENEILGPSSLDYFFQDDAMISCDGQKYEIIQGTAKNSEYSFVLSLKNNLRKRQPVFPKGEKLEVQMNTHQLQKQLNALNILKNKPLSSQYNILKLFEQIKTVNWKDFEVNQLKDEEYKILKDKSRKGNLKQREFVNKALSTSDFMILEGPPGSGKTTAILELINELIKRGKRILLSSSTHVAIDNVLERLKERNMLENILPIRVGDKNKISDGIKEFQIDEILNSTKVEEKLILESANLVCGTTIGILQHPLIKNKKKDQSIFASFDYLIIDESSKTTFSEFLVPALYAKKWILVGDVNQLSPYTDRETIESHISMSFPDENKKEIIFLLNILCTDLIKNFFRNKKNKFIVPIKEEQKKFLEKELIEKTKNDEIYKDKKYLIIKESKSKFIENYGMVSKKQFKEQGIVLGEYYDGIFASLDDIEEIQNYISEDFILLKTKEAKYSFNFSQKYYKDLDGFQVKDRGNIKKGKDAIDYINTFFVEKTWASELAWRMIRIFELKGNTNNSKLEKEIEALIPKGLEKKELEKIRKDIFSIKQVALPSILECLQRGISKKDKHNLTTTLTEGFENIRKNKKIFEKRFVKLEYQYRMHKDISEIPRNIFYKGKALKDDELDRGWDYKNYKKRSVWLDHKNHAKGSYNSEEVKIIKKELKSFFQWAKESEKVWEVGIITFYRAQERKLREMLRKYCSENSNRTQNNKMSRFYLEDRNKIKVNIKLYTVDKFQGQEADMIFLSMVNTKRTGFLDNPNRLNVSITRAKYQMVYVGYIDYYRKSSSELREIAENIYLERR
ncbi:AAA domain-containing protein [Fusobacterium sp. MFO224]|uniref:AAA domain-containing protein n=1 Tax=Fusobacterium sp. MFO224 TaxID=3378070 RepID=UPI003854124F